MAEKDPKDMSVSDRSIQRCTTLLWYLASRGHSREEINRLVQDLFNVIRDGGSFTIAMINGEMEARGWPAHVVDEASFEMLAGLMQDEMGYSVTSHTVN